MKQYRLRFNLDNELDNAAYEKLMKCTESCSLHSYICSVIEQEYQRQLIINTIRNDIEQYKKENGINGK